MPRNRTGKSNIGREEVNLVTLAVDPRANKHEIRHAVETLFEVDVIAVRTMRMPRKSRRVGRFLGRKPEWKKALVQLDGAPFRALAAARERWAAEDHYRYPGAIQYFGPPEVTSAVTETLRLEHTSAE